MTTTANPTRPPTPVARPTLPKGLKWSSVWKVDGQFVEADLDADGRQVELPVNAAWEICGRLWVCPVDGCVHDAWTFEPVTDDTVPCCPKHPARMVSTAVDGSDTDPVKGARARVAEHIRGVYEARKLRAQQAVQARIDAAHQAVAEATRRTAADMRGHVPSIAASVSVLTLGVWLEVQYTPLVALVSAAVGTVGAVVAYLVAYLARRINTADRDDPKQAKTDRRVARHVAAGTMATGMWLLASAAASVLPLTGHLLFTVLLGLLLMFAVNNQHWQDLWATRHRIKDMLRRKAEADALRAQREADNADRRPQPAPAAEVDESDPAVVGTRMAAEWARIAAGHAAANAFPAMSRTWLVPDETAPVTAPIDGKIVRIGWEFHGQAEPGALVAGRGGTQPPVVAARDWLAAVLFDGRHHPSTVSLVDRPGGAANRFTLMITDSVPLGEPVRWQGKAGVRRTPDGTIQVHRGRSIDGNDVHHSVYIPGQAFGGLVVGTRGGGKTGGTILYLLNCLAAGIFPILFDPKQLVDYADFIGVLPIGVTLAHRDVITDYIVAQRKARERLMARRPVTDEFGRQVHGESLWDLNDGPPITHVWEEFHDLANNDEAWVTKRMTNHIRLERSSAMGGLFITQGGGLADLSNSVLRGLLNQTELTTYRMDDHQARLAGRKEGAYTASDLPPLPGMCLVTAPEVPPLPMRTAYVPRTVNHPESVFNVLYGRGSEKVPQFPMPELPDGMKKIMRHTGLWELWERAQGPGGLDRLLVDAEDEEYGGPSPAPPVGGALPAAEVLLAVISLRPGCTRAFIDTHGAWMLPAGGGKAPVPSTISRAAKKLEADGRLTRTDGTYWVTEAGKGVAASTAATLGLTKAEVAKPAEDQDADDPDE